MLSWEDLKNQIWNVIASADNGNSNWIFMQYTGLKDKNGKEIYEGDIITKVITFYTDKTHSKTESHNGVVEWGVEHDSDGYRHNEWLGWLADTKLKGTHPRSLKDVHSGCEIIGNVYENPELIKSP